MIESADGDIFPLCEASEEIAPFSIQQFMQRCLHQSNSQELLKPSAHSAFLK